MTSVLRTGRGGRRGVSACVLAVAVLLAGCGQGDEDASGPSPVASGVVFDSPDGKPLSGVQLELVVWPSPGASNGGGKQAPQTMVADTDTSGADGAFSLEAEAHELTPHAASDGLVGIEVKVVGSELPGTRTTVRLERDADTGVTSVVETSGLVITVAKNG